MLLSVNTEDFIPRKGTLDGDRIRFYDSHACFVAGGRTPAGSQLSR